MSSSCSEKNSPTSAPAPVRHRARRQSGSGVSSSVSCSQLANIVALSPHPCLRVPLACDASIGPSLLRCCSSPHLLLPPALLPCCCPAVPHESRQTQRPPAEPAASGPFLEAVTVSQSNAFRGPEAGWCPFRRSCLQTAQPRRTDARRRACGPAAWQSTSRCSPVVLPSFRRRCAGISCSGFGPGAPGGLPQCLTSEHALAPRSRLFLRCSRDSGGEL